MNTLPPEELLQEYFNERLALARLKMSQGTEWSFDTNLTIHEFRVLMLLASGLASTRHRLSQVLEVPVHSVNATLGHLVELGYVDGLITQNDLRPTEQAMDILDTFAERRDSVLDVMMIMDPHDLAALVNGTRALREAMEQVTINQGYSPPAGASPHLERQCA